MLPPMLPPWMDRIVADFQSMTSQDWIEPQEPFNPDTDRFIGVMTLEQKNLLSLFQKYSLLANQTEDSDEDLVFSEEVKWGMAADILLQTVVLEIVEHFGLKDCNGHLAFREGWQVVEVLQIQEDDPLALPSLEVGYAGLN